MAPNRDRRRIITADDLHSDEDCRVPGLRYMQDDGLWSVYDWEPALCDRCEGSGYAVSPGVPEAGPCHACQGKGEFPDTLVPVLAAEGLLEEDARLLVFGPDLLAACEAALRFIGSAVEDEEYEEREGPALRLNDLLATAIANASPPESPC